MEANFAQHLKSRTSITDIVGTRVYSYYLPQGTRYPAIVYRVVSATHDHTISASPALGIMSCRIQLDIVSDRLSQVSILNEAIRQELDGYSGAMGNATCIRCKLANEIGFVTEPEDASDTWIYRRAVDYLVRYKISIPTLGTAGVAMAGLGTVASTYQEVMAGGLVTAGLAAIN